MIDADLAQRERAAVAGLGGGVDRLRACGPAEQFGLVLGEHLRCRVDRRLDRMLAQQAERQRVQRADRRLVQVLAVAGEGVVGHHCAAHALAHLRSGGLRERHRRDLREAATFQQPQVALDQDVRLAAPGACRDREVGGVRLDDRELLGGQLHVFHRVN